MRHTTGIGGIFFKANDPEKLGEWYRKHLGLDVQEFGGVVFRENEAPAEGPIGGEGMGGEGFEPPTYWV